MKSGVQLEPLSDYVWHQRFRMGDEADIETSWARVARALAAPEPADRPLWESRFHEALDQFRFLPGGRILAGACAACSTVSCRGRCTIRCPACSAP